jgi:hypothetical protein
MRFHNTGGFVDALAARARYANSSLAPMIVTFEREVRKDQQGDRRRSAALLV